MPVAMDKTRTLWAMMTNTDGSGAIARDYDHLNRLVSETTPQGAVTYGYDTDPAHHQWTPC